MLEPGYGYVDAQAVQRARDQAARGSARPRSSSQAGGKLRGLVLDLRNNPGGLLDQAVRVATCSSRAGPSSAPMGKGGRDHRRGARPAARHARRLPDDRAGQRRLGLGLGDRRRRAAGPRARGDHGHARPSARASVQTLIEFPQDGSALKLTIARYYTPKGRSIQEQGITPDVLVEQVKLPSPRRRTTARRRSATCPATCATSRAARPAAAPLR